MSEEKKSYRDSLNLPETGFAMKANLTEKEPIQRKDWAKQDMYGQIRKNRQGKPLYILHDGPPYANGDIHMGHVINKVLKDIVLKYKTMSGYDTPYIPGWDCHGLPIEVKVMAELGEKALEMEKTEIRKLCQKYASKFVKNQSKQFSDLGIFADYDNPYLTMKPQYEKGILEVFAELVGNSLVYKQLKPIHWSVGCQTALADAELEYKDISSPSVYVNFPATKESRAKLVELGLIESDCDSKACFMIWTTTPWTLAANLAITVHPNLEYRSITYTKAGQEFTSIVVADRIEAVIAAGGLTEDQFSISIATAKGSQLESLRYEHPYIGNPTDKDAHFVILGDFVTTEDGTGLVHTAPGHGADDYLTGQKYGLAVYSPVKDDGSYDETTPSWLQGKNVLKIDGEVIAKLEELGLLFAKASMMHSYPHCWRSKMPVIFRATEQWFISVDKTVEKFDGSLRQMALKKCGDVTWVPNWGEKRIRGMLESRPDWCISRQRAWGLPIPAFYNSNGDSLLTKESILAVANHIGQKGSNSWFTDSPQEILGSDFKLPAGFSFDDLKKEENIFDVWFESGCSWHSVARNAGWPVPVDLYLEGSDQHRGWFQLSMLPALGAIGNVPFKTVLTHGFTVDEKGMKQSKSLGNYVNAQEEINKYGSDILRLWVSSVNYQEDMRCSDVLIGRLQDAYRKIRNTIRYLLGNINGFDAATMSIDYSQMHEIDKWAMQKFNTLVDEILNAYENFAFHRVFSLVYNFCSVDMSSIYMDVLKDRMYCDDTKSLSRRSAQTTMVTILDGLTRLIAPVLAHTAEEIWKTMNKQGSVHLANMPAVDKSFDAEKDAAKWQTLMNVRDEVLKVLEDLRKQEKIASNQEASINIEADTETVKILNAFGLDNFAALCIVSEVKLSSGDTLKVVAQKSSHEKCARCWNFWPSVGKDSQFPDLCSRCIDVIAAKA